MVHAELANKLTTLLALDRTPVGLAFVDSAPEGVATADQVVPSACSFWTAAEHNVFYAAADQHFNCPVGAMVMGFDLPEEVTGQLGGLVQSMCDARYLDPAEAANIPSVGRGNAGIVYGPYGAAPVEPDLVLLWLTPAQTMVFNEAAGGASWTADAPMSVSGRPGCSALPLALHNDRPQASLGCIGMRTFTEVPDDRILAVLPAGRVAEFVEALEATVQANAAMKQFYTEKKASIG